MKKLPVEIERIFGMIKAKGTSVSAYYDEVSGKWNIKLADEVIAYVTDEGLSKYAEIKGNTYG